MVLKFTEESRNKYFSFALVYMVSFLCFLNTINAVFGIVGMASSIDTFLLYVSIWAVIFGGMLLVVARARRISIDVLLLIVGVLVAYAVSYLLLPENAAYMKFNHLYYVGNPVYALFVFSLPAYAFVRQLTDYSYFKKYLTIFSYIAVILSTVTFFFARDTSAAGYMTLSYNMIFQLFYLMITKTNHKFLRIPVVVIGVFVLAFGGSRGALLSLLAGIGIFFLFKKMDIRKKILLLVSILVAILIMLFFSRELLTLVSYMLRSMNIESRSFDMLVSLEFFDESGREVLRDTLTSNISVFGHGMYGDRVLLEGMYAHNIILEMITQYGIIFGTALILCIVFFIIKGITRKEAPEWVLIIAVVPHGIISLMLSGSYLSVAPCFYLLLGLCMNSLLRKKQSEGYIEA